MRLVLLPLLAVPWAASPGQDSDPRTLFPEHCAACHGEKGDGRGATPLPRPARSFLDGGFSYGNTRVAIGRTLEHGIPGTPMPSFAAALSAEQRAALVEYVIALGPERREVSRRETVLEVTDRPRVVRGFLPALAEGAHEHPRGLLVGLTSGTTFQYRADDVRLLAVRQGEFVERRDWSGRGGNPLRPLGTVTHLVEGGKPGAAWSAGGALRARLKGTVIREDTVTIRLDLERDGRTIAHVTETPRVFQSRHGSGFVREISLRAAAQEARVQFRWGEPIEDFDHDIYRNKEFEWVFSFVEDAGREGPNDRRRGRHQLVVVRSGEDDFDPARTATDDVSAHQLSMRVEPNRVKTVSVYVLTLADTPEGRAGILQELGR